MEERLWLPGTERLGFRQPSPLWQDAPLARQSSHQNSVTHGSKSWDHETDWVAYVPAYLQLVAGGNGQYVKVVQELMRHSKISTTMEVYAQAGMEQKRVAQRKAVDLLLGRKPRNASHERAAMECSHTVPTRSYPVPRICGLSYSN